MSKKYFRPAVRILKLSKSFKILLIERAVGFLPPRTHPPLLCPGHLLRGFLTVSEMPMTIFEAVKTTVAPRMAADHFGLSVNRNGMVCCPFHDDRHPSMKLYEDHYHCFGCQANGDVIAFTSKLFGITPLEAAQKLAADFGIREDRPSVLAKLKVYTTQAENEKLCFRVLSEYLHILQDWKKRYAPQTPEEEPDDRFVEACHMLECTQYMLDLLTIGSHEERAKLVKDMMKDNKITLLQERLQEIKEEMNE